MSSGVYEPREDSFLLRRHIPSYAKGRVLDMGTGSGVLAVEAAKFAKEVVAVDVNPEAVAALQERVAHSLQNVSVVQSDLFSRVKGQFDCILCNPPYLPLERGYEDLALDGGVEGWEWSARFVREAKAFLRPQGSILLVASSRSRPKKLEAVFRHEAFAFQCIDAVTFDFEEVLLYVLRHDAPDALHWGKRSVVFRATRQGRRVAVKRARTPRFRGHLLHEARVLEEVNALGIGPSLLGVGGPPWLENKVVDELALEWIDGVRIGAFLLTHTAKELVPVLRLVFRQLSILDDAGWEKGEMTNPYKHILVRGNVPVLIDFERARKSVRRRNVTQFCQYLCCKGVLPVLQEKGLAVRVGAVREVMRAYAKGSATVEDVLGVFGLKE
ncbi:methyltransferase domain-containing protein [Candidatus Woesearchaeota archaeon]|nr:MAG: methyltransferase domain-containing protein [Candidatus Woesearchaeota archaeon]